jgi:hypothetical protein
MGTKKISSEQSIKIQSLLSQKVFTIQDVVNALDCEFTENQIRYHVNKYYPDLKGNFKKEYSKGGTKLEYLLKQLFPARLIEAEYHIGERLRVDFLVGAPYHIAFEFDGSQHSQYSSFLHGDRSSFRESIERDTRKEFLLTKRGVTLVRLADLDIDLQALKQLVDSVGYGTGVIEETYLTTEERSRKRTSEQRAKYLQARKAHEEVLRSTVQKKVNKQSPLYDSKKAEFKERQREIRKEQYQKAKEWRKKMKQKN